MTVPDPPASSSSTPLVARSPYLQRGLLPLGWFLMQLRRAPDPEWLALGRELLPRFSQMGYVAVACASSGSGMAITAPPAAAASVTYTKPASASPSCTFCRTPETASSLSTTFASTRAS